MNKHYAFEIIKKKLIKISNLPTHGCCLHFKDEIQGVINHYEKRYLRFSLELYDNGFYLGDIKDGEKNGYGFYVWNNGCFYAGYWVDGEEEGEYGLYVYEQGTVFIGEFKDGLRDGHGCLRHSNGIEIEGDYKNDKRVKAYHNSDDYQGRRAEVAEGNSGCYVLIIFIIIIFFIYRSCS